MTGENESDTGDGREREPSLSPAGDPDSYRTGRRVTGIGDLGLPLRDRNPEPLG